jgi:hypothetical protein
VEELSEQGAKTAAFDILFNELRSDHPPVRMADDTLIENDDYFARQMRQAGNVVLADTGDASLTDLFATNALALGDITAEKDSGGMLPDAGQWHQHRHGHGWVDGFKRTSFELHRVRTRG